VNEEGGRGVGNERLEFLGDAVLDLAISELLMERRPEADEGQLSRARAELVNTRALARHAQHLGLDRSVRLGRGEARSAGRRKISILANVFEAVVAALYLDGGLAPVRALVEREFGARLEDPGLFEADPKTRLQERLQAEDRPTPVYTTSRTEGPDHAPEFHVEARVGDEVVGRGVGRSKREAEQQAARQALERLDQP
jgi:ribonuclease-3